MPAEYIIDEARGIVFTRAFGTLTDDDLREHASRLKADARLKPYFRQIADFSDVQELTVTAAGVRAIAGAANPFGPAAVRAVYAPQDALFGLARMFEAAHDASHLLVTRDRAAAERHVGLEAGESKRIFSSSQAKLK